MGVPILGDVDLDAIREIADSSLRQEAVLQTEASQWAAGAKEIRVWVPQTWDQKLAHPALLTPASEGGTNIQADQVTPAGAWVLALEAGQPVTEGQRVVVRGYVNDERKQGVLWERRLAVTKVLYPRQEIRRRAFCVDLGVV